MKIQSLQLNTVYMQETLKWDTLREMLRKALEVVEARESVPAKRRCHRDFSQCKTKIGEISFCNQLSKKRIISLAHTFLPAYVCLPFGSAQIDDSGMLFLPTEASD